MFFILSKILFYIAMPLVWITLLILFALITKSAIRKKRSLIAALVMVFFFGNEFIINEVLTAWEKKPVYISKLPVYDYAIVLTGVTNTEVYEYPDRVFFGKGADRLLHTVQLYKLGKVKKIIISGGDASIVSKPVIESEQLRKVFLLCDVPDEDILIENKSRNTRENAAFTKAFIDSLQLKGDFLLITSAFHMRRSEACFNKVGLHPDIYPVDLFTRDRKFTPNLLFIPLESALSKWSLLIHEVIGYVVYKIMGYA